MDTIMSRHLYLNYNLLRGFYTIIVIIPEKNI